MLSIWWHPSQENSEANRFTCGGGHSYPSALPVRARDLSARAIRDQMPKTNSTSKRSNVNVRRIAQECPAPHRKTNCFRTTRKTHLQQTPLHLRLRRSGPKKVMQEAERFRQAHKSLVRQLGDEKCLRQPAQLVGSPLQQAGIEQFDLPRFGSSTASRERVEHRREIAPRNRRGPACRRATHRLPGLARRKCRVQNVRLSLLPASNRWSPRHKSW